MLLSVLITPSSLSSAKNLFFFSDLSLSLLEVIVVFSAVGAHAISSYGMSEAVNTLQLACTICRVFIKLAALNVTAIFVFSKYRFFVFWP